MKVQEFLDLYNEEKKQNRFYSIFDVEDLIPSACPCVARDLDIDRHRWYEISTSVYHFEDGFVGITGPSKVFSESMSFSDCCWENRITVDEFDEYTTISYKRKRQE